MDVAEQLALFGLTRQEAQLYLSLLAEGDLSGYEAAKQAGISRSNAYAGLSSLVAKGAAYLLDGPVPRYAALDAETFFRHRVRALEDAASSLAPVLPRRRTAPEGYLTVAGPQAVLDRMKTMVEGAEQRLYFSLSRTLVAPLVPFLQRAVARGVTVTALAEAPLDVPGAVVHPTVPPEGQIRLIVDSQEVLTGEWDASGEASCLYSRRPALVALFKQALGNEIRLLELESTPPKEKS
jgi:sugar-specific transcriptional regulator TrmB